jgi:hypothetical protein
MLQPLAHGIDVPGHDLHGQGSFERFPLVESPRGEEIALLKMKIEHVLDRESPQLLWDMLERGDKNGQTGSLGF